ncbi:TPA: PKD domain-containing protein, partial [Candidatus Bipolaricaulota bacterium]|nr:PKD domain-containing protein [Candidatus Bipolaricaulota bacterium]
MERRDLRVALLVVLASLILLGEGSADPTAVVTMGNGSAAPGRPTKVRLSIVGVPEAGLSDLQGSLTYDPQVVHVESLKGLNDYQVFAYKVDNDLGRARFVVVKVTGKFLREGEILQFTMRAVGKVGDTSLLELTLEALNDPEGKPIAHRIENGTFTIKAQQAAFTFRPTEPRVDEIVQFIDQSVGNIVSWLWDFGDGTGSTEQNPTHKYSLAGTYTVKLLVEDSAGATDIAYEEITVRPPNRPPRADFTFSPASPTLADTIQFTDRSTDPDGDETLSSWSWDFGDGETSTERNPTHTYAKAGTYTVKLKVTDNEGASDTVSKEITVIGEERPPQADFSFSPENPKPREEVQFTDRSSDPDGEIVR